MPSIYRTRISTLRAFFQTVLAIPWCIRRATFAQIHLLKKSYGVANLSAKRQRKTEITLYLKMFAFCIYGTEYLLIHRFIGNANHFFFNVKMILRCVAAYRIIIISGGSADFRIIIQNGNIPDSKMSKIPF